MELSGKSWNWNIIPGSFVPSEHSLAILPSVVIFHNFFIGIEVNNRNGVSWLAAAK